MVSHSPTHKPDLANQPSNVSPELSTLDFAVPSSLAHDVMHLQRLIGNRATSQLIATKGKTALGALNRNVLTGEPVIQRVMSADAFEEKTAVNLSSRSGLKQIDHVLKLIDQSGADALLLNDLQNAIEAWLSTEEADGPRRAGVDALQAEASEELRRVNEKREDQGIVFGRPVFGPSKKYDNDFSDFDSKQYRVSGRAPNRLIEEVKRTVTQDSRVVYFAMGVVTSFNGKAPVVSPYPEPLSLGDWYPSVTHLNGMDVNPREGIQSASALQESVNEALEGENDVALGQDAVDVLYTYSAKRGGLTADVWDCIKGKVSVEDAATVSQEKIMLDAIRNKHRVSMSAHSRGTIKTDTAVMAVHDILSAEYLSATRAEYYKPALAHWQGFADEYGVSAEEMAEMSVKQVAGKKAKEDMNTYIHLVYAGNAVTIPSSLLKPTMYVGGLDGVSMFVGSYTSTLMGTKSVGAFKTHSFDDNYVPAVSKDIAADIKNH